MVGGLFGLGYLLGPNATGETVVVLTFLDWIVAGIMLAMAVIGKKRQYSVNHREYEVSERVKCPYCAELIMSDAKVCRFCNRELETALDVVERDDSDSEYVYIKCPHCRYEQWDQYDRQCLNCGKLLAL